MIAHVEGSVAEKFGASVIVDVHGIGYEVQVAASDFETAVLDQTVKFYTYHHIREQSQELFGFTSLMAKKLFELLISVQGVGPKAALSILSLGESERVRNAIASSDGAFISKASGVGKKTADRVIVDLQDKVGVATHFTNAESQTDLPLAGDDALDALMALGYTLNDASEALKDVPGDLPTAQRVTQALRAN
jgi:Holliday junction DNA helicase RuvA